MKYDHEKIREALGVALKEFDMQPSQTSDAVFHMTDWLDDLEEWTMFCEKPEALLVDQVLEILMRFLVHVPNHVAAASKLITGIPVTDIFEIGATEESED